MKKLILCLLCISLMIAFISCQEPESTGSSFGMMKIGGTEITVDADAASILSALGEAKDYDESPSCAFEGMDKIYVYNGFRIQTYTMSGKDYIRSVELLDDTYSTPEGITIGSATEAVTAAYGAPTKQTDTGLQYVQNERGVTMQFLLRDGLVTNIQYFKNVNNQ